MGASSLRTMLCKLLDIPAIDISDAELETPGRIRNAYLHGFENFDKLDDHNPYPEGSKEHVAWKIGYDQNDRRGRPM